MTSKKNYQKIKSCLKNWRKKGGGCKTRLKIVLANTTLMFVRRLCEHLLQCLRIKQTNCQPRQCTSSVKLPTTKTLNLSLVTISLLLRNACGKFYVKEKTSARLLSLCLWTRLESSSKARVSMKLNSFSNFMMLIMTDYLMLVILFKGLLKCPPVLL